MALRPRPVSRRRSRRSPLAARPGTERWGPADWAHHRRGQRIEARHRRDRRRRAAGWAGWTAAAALVATAAVGLSARSVRPGTTWIPQVAAVGLPVLGPALALAALVAGGVAARTRRPSAAAGALLLAVAAGAVLFRNAAPPPGGAEGDGLRVVTLNAGQWSAESNYRLAEYLQAADPHVVALQETDVRSVLRDGQRAQVLGPAAMVLQREGYVAAGGVAGQVADQRGPANRQVVYTKLPVVEHAAAELGPSDTDPSVYARVVVEWRGQRVAVYNVHLRPFNPTAGWSLARALSPRVWAETPGQLRAYFGVQTEEAERLASLVAAEPHPFVVVGDFNATPDQWGRAFLAAHADEVFGRSLWAATRPDGVPLAAIDGILVGAGWGVTDAEVGPPGLSDHRALWAELVYGDR